MSFENVDLLDIDVHGLHSEPFYEWLREKAPLFRDAKNSLWAVSRYDDVSFVSKHPEIFCNAFGVVPGSDGAFVDEAMINLDGEAHTRQRGLVSKGFTPRRIAELEGKVRDITDELIDQVAAKGECDLVADIARPLPMNVIGGMLGYAPEWNAKVLEWTDVYVHGGNGPAYAAQHVAEMADAFMKFAAFHTELLAQRKQQRGDDLISIWLDAELDGQRLTDEKIFWEHNLLLVGGSESTRNAIAGGMYELLQRPADLAYLREHPDAIPNAAEEMVRWTSPFVRMQRTLLRDHELHGVTMKKNDKILMIYPAANRDPRAFTRPQEFDARREFTKPAVAFGIGKHYCLGASLARLEIKVFLERLLARLPDIRIAPGYTPRIKPGSFVRGLAALPVHFTPSA
jgi:cytochrome P450 family 142 subfamily A polypeptide 1